MFKQETEHTATDLLADDQLELVCGGMDATGNIPICPPPPAPLIAPHNPNAPIWKY